VHFHFVLVRRHGHLRRPAVCPPPSLHSISIPAAVFPPAIFSTAGGHFSSNDSAADGNGTTEGVVCSCSSLVLCKA
jgi:hypothetical protein